MLSEQILFEYSHHKSFCIYCPVEKFIVAGQNLDLSDTDSNQIK